MTSGVAEADVAFSPVERKALAASALRATYAPDEKIPVVVVENFPALGRLAAMRFLEWAQDHPGGTISLPTGRTPEHFIRWVKRLLGTWSDAETQALLDESGIDPARKPDLRSLRFVQIDEFYPIDPAQHNSFHYYVNRFYIDGFGFDPGRALLIDCARIGLDPGVGLADVWPDFDVDLTLRTRAARSALEATQQRTIARIDQWCQEYEQTLRDGGGIGFFLGGIGPDGHIGFNVRGSDHFSTTRLTPTNYETQAAAASDLGGIEIARKRLVITIGLGTIAYNPDCVAVIVAAGEAKAKIVADAVQQQAHVLYPATALHKLPHARFYLTRGATRLLHARRHDVFVRDDAVDEATIAKIIVDLSVKTGKRVTDLDEADFAGDRFGRTLLDKRPEGRVALCARVREALVARIEAGTSRCTDTCFLHTEPHHDDLLLGYLPAIVRNVRDSSNTHHFVTLTSGFTAVSNAYLKRRLTLTAQFLNGPAFPPLATQDYFSTRDWHCRNRDVWQYLDGVASGSEAMQNEGAARRMISDLVALFGTDDDVDLLMETRRLCETIDQAYPGKRDPEHIQKLKGMCREWEAECLWGYFGWGRRNVHHLRLGFYTGDIFTPEPTEERDVEPILELMNRVHPDVLSAAFDPEASGPDTHYKVMQAIRAALDRYTAQPDVPPLRVWGYRNVWYRFHPSEANLYVPVSLNMFTVMDSSFRNTFVSQREASFPSHEHDGPFCELAQRIQVEQYQMLKTCLGREWFHDHTSPLIRAARGLVFLKEMSVDEFRTYSRDLRRHAEDGG